MDLTFKPAHYLYGLYGGLTAFVAATGLVLAGVVNWHWLIATYLVYAYLAIMNSAGYHRLFCHYSYDTTPFWELLLLLSGAMSCYGSSIQYCVVHTWHHDYSDTAKDPHSFKTLKDVFRANYHIDNIPLSARKAMAHLLERPLHAFVHRNFWAFPTSLAIVLFLFGGWQVLLFGYLAPVGLVIFSAAMFNYLAHDDDGPNNDSMVLFVSGEGRHKLHHQQPWRWDLREKWWHIDPSAYLIMLIKR